MIDYAVKSQTPVALAFQDSMDTPAQIVPGQKLNHVRSVAGYGNPNILERRDNGTLLILLQGIGKVNLSYVKATHTSFIVCEAERVQENLKIEEPVKKSLEVLHRVLVRWSTKNISGALERDTFIKSLIGPEELIGAFSAYMLKDYDMQQHILELNDINEKINILYRLTESNELAP